SMSKCFACLAQDLSHLNGRHRGTVTATGQGATDSLRSEHVPDAKCLSLLGMKSEQEFRQEAADSDSRASSPERKRQKPSGNPRALFAPQCRESSALRSRRAAPAIPDCREEVDVKVRSFLKIHKVMGGSIDPAHLGWSDLLGWSWVAGRAVGSAAGDG